MHICLFYVLIYNYFVAVRSVLCTISVVHMSAYAYASISKSKT